jgi:hypothetical protein
MQAQEVGKLIFVINLSFQASKTFSSELSLLTTALLKFLADIKRACQGKGCVRLLIMIHCVIKSWPSSKFVEHING